jgi:hypothetical protein
MTEDAMTEHPEIRRIPGGSIDYHHYTRVGRRLHALAVREAMLKVLAVAVRWRALLATCTFQPRRAYEHSVGRHRWKRRYLA